jgi:hypothetical protein
VFGVWCLVSDYPRFALKDPENYYSPQRRKDRRVTIFFALPLRRRQDKTTQPFGHQITLTLAYYLDKLESSGNNYKF